MILDVQEYSIVWLEFKQVCLDFILFLETWYNGSIQKTV